MEKWFKVVDKIEAELDAGKGVTGKAAALFLCSLFENETHGNYEGGIMYTRSRPETEFEIRIKKKR